MPYVNIKITKENGTPTTEQKQRIIKGVTNLLGEVLGRSTDSLVVVIDEVECDNYGVGGISITQKRKANANLS
ncbi:4-oxalocrotonate tautomerase family protein [Helicobacter sp. MIT 05-5294]|uniref:2-hydroxymuconate tautomerase family protein n=1 Tax=Helicobacter sp. MIT 05-5294 TaxID=1548150 RepID=UPI00051FDEE9|nr:4-oxalocrotonate tautomerase family protein [Helicobacter sp. MIT 05-5294]TLD86064.1 4-oxalocrotonate tautomerase family protein [Helicobacter sp. MIT 05-5294]